MITPGKLRLRKPRSHCCDTWVSLRREYPQEGRARQVARSSSANPANRAPRASRGFFLVIRQKLPDFRKIFSDFSAGFDRYNQQWSPEAAGERLCRGPNDVRNYPDATNSIRVKHDLRGTWIRYVEASLRHAICFSTCVYVLPRLICDSLACDSRTGAGADFSYFAPIHSRCTGSCNATAASCFGDVHG